MADTKVTVLDNGPYLLAGNVELVDAEGNHFEVKEQIALCRCGHSKNKPFCDGAHHGTFESTVRASK